MISSSRARRTPAPIAFVLLLLAFLLLPGVGRAFGAEAAPPHFFGVNATGLTARDFRMFGSENVETLRTVFPFATVRSRPGEPYDWDAFDAIVRGTASRGIELVPILYGTAPWISPDRSAVPLGDADAVSEWREYLTALVERYGAGGEFWAENPSIPAQPIEAWQIWNEPNSKTWWGPRPRPSEYALLLKRSAVAIRSADPAARIVTAGIVAHPTNRHGIPGISYVQRLLSLHRSREAIDVLAIHPFAASAAAALRQVAAARGVVERAGVGSMPIWITEIGWGSRGPRDKTLIKSEEGQLRALEETFALALEDRRRLNVRRVLWYHWRDADDELCQWCRTSGLLDRNYREKPLAIAFRRLAGP